MRVGRKTARGCWKGQQLSVAQRDQWFECQAGSRGPSALGLWITGRSSASRLEQIGCLPSGYQSLLTSLYYTP